MHGARLRLIGFGASFDDRCGDVEVLDVFRKQPGQFARLFIVGRSILPGCPRVDVAVVYAGNALGEVEIESVQVLWFRISSAPLWQAWTTARVTGMGKREPVPPGAPEPPVHPVFTR